MDGETLLMQTRRRISQLITPRQTLLVLTKTHSSFYADEVRDIPSARLLVQPRNQGTAPAILYSLLRIREMDSDAAVAFFPSDHHFSDDTAFTVHMNSAFTAASRMPGKVILLGIPPVTAEADYGWIEPGVSSDVPPAADSVFPVTRFWEKPNPVLASALMARGCLWNSFVMVGHISAFLNLFRNALPDLIQAFESRESMLSDVSDMTALRDLYSSICQSGFSQDVLSVQPEHLAVLLAASLGWSDLGEPGRVLSVLARKGIQTEWGTQMDRPDQPLTVRTGAAG
jgi:mannose-1-phosphate guanylyltransferase